MTAHDPKPTSRNEDHSGQGVSPWRSQSCRVPAIGKSGGVFDFGNAVLQSNNATQVGVAIGGNSGITFGNAGNASVNQSLYQANVSSIS